jgi:hypothetical protein
MLMEAASAIGAQAAKDIVAWRLISRLLVRRRSEVADPMSGFFMLAWQLSFTVSQGLASVLAMCLNFSVNNAFTHRDRKLSGLRFLKGLLSFIAICSVGAFANL